VYLQPTANSGFKDGKSLVETACQVLAEHVPKVAVVSEITLLMLWQILS